MFHIEKLQTDFIYKHVFVVTAFCSLGDRGVHTGRAGCEDEETREDLQLE